MSSRPINGTAGVARTLSRAVLRLSTGPFRGPDRDKEVVRMAGVGW